MTTKLNSQLHKKLETPRTHEGLLEAIVKERELVLDVQVPFEYHTRFETAKLKLKNKSDEKSLKQYAGLLFHLNNSCPNGNTNPCFRTYAEYLKQFPESPVPFHALGKILMDEQLFYQSHLMFDNGLRLKVQDSDDEHLNLHRRFHLALCDLAHRISVYSPDSKLSEHGFPTKELAFKFHPEVGFYLSRFPYKTDDYQIPFCAENEDRTLTQLHRELGDIKTINEEPHKADNCPYLGYVDKQNY